MDVDLSSRQWIILRKQNITYHKHQGISNCLLKHHSKQSATLKHTEAAAGRNILHLSPFRLLRTLKSSWYGSTEVVESAIPVLQKQKE